MTTQTTTLPRSATARLSKIGLLEALLAIIGFGISVIGAIEIADDPRLANQLALGIVIACSVFLTYQSVVSFRAMWVRNPHNYGTVSQVDDDGTVVLVSEDEENSYTYIKVTDDSIIRSEKSGPGSRHEQ